MGNGTVEGSPGRIGAEVVRRIVNNGRTVGLAGYSPLIGWTRNGWWETVNDIAHDIKRKYRYYVVTDVGQVELTLAEGRVTAVTGDKTSWIVFLRTARPRTPHGSARHIVGHVPPKPAGTVGRIVHPESPDLK